MPALCRIAPLLFLVGCSDSVWRGYTSPDPIVCSQYLQRCRAGASYCSADTMRMLCGSVSGVSEDIYDFRSPDPVDILFVIDNSTSMSPKQKALAQAIPTFISRLSLYIKDYHIGIVTSDVGTLPVGQTNFPGSTENRCNTARGDDGILQNLPCSFRIPVSDQNTEFALACKGAVNPLCPDPSFVPRDRWIARNNVGVNVTPTNPGALTTDEITQRAFQCIGFVGDYGCGVEAPLEAMKRALDGHALENKGFLRDNSTLAVILLTDEDDCSAQLEKRPYLNPRHKDCGSLDPDPDYECFNLDYRCISKSLICNEPLNTPGKKTGCRERADSFLESTQKYANFLLSIRPANKLVLAGAWAPSILDHQANGYVGDGQLEIDGAAGDYSSNVLNRGQKTKAACYDPDPMMRLTTSPAGFFGQAQLRLSSFIRQFPTSVFTEQNICDVANYSKLFDGFAENTNAVSRTKCLSNPIPDGKDAVCAVGFVDVNQPNAVPDIFLPTCSAACCNAWASQREPNAGNSTIIAACMPQPEDCYCAVPSMVGRCPGTAVAGVWRQGNRAYPAGKVANFRCATKP